MRIPPGLQVLVVQLLGREEKYDELRQFIAGKLIEPSRAVAVQLLEVGSNHAQTRKLGMEMLRLLHAHSDYVKLLLQDGRLLEGLRYIRQNKVWGLHLVTVIFTETLTIDVIYQKYFVFSITQVRIYQCPSDEFFLICGTCPFYCRIAMKM